MVVTAERRKSSSMRPTDVLRAEHDHILRGCAILEAMANKLDDGAAVPVEDATAIVDFIRFYADGLHHAKEEHVLFPAMEEAGLPRDGGPIGVMLFEHERGREQVAKMLAAIPALATPTGRRGFVEGARNFATLLEQHIAKENMVLFVMAERLLGPLRDTAILNAYAEREGAARAICGDKATHEAKLAELTRRWL